MADAILSRTLNPCIYLQANANAFVVSSLINEPDYIATASSVVVHGNVNSEDYGIPYSMPRIIASFWLMSGQSSPVSG